MAKLDRSVDSFSQKDGPKAGLTTAKKKTFRKALYDDNESETWGQPSISLKSKEYMRKRAKSSGDIGSQLYLDGVLRRERQFSAERESQMSLRRKNYVSVLENAGISNGSLTQSDRYQAVKLTKEFDAALARLGLQTDAQLGKSAVFDVLIDLKLLK